MRTLRVVRSGARKTIAMVPGAVWFKRNVIDQYSRRTKVPTTRPRNRSAPPKPNLHRSDTRETTQPHPTDANFVLYRIIGNDLIPRHRRGQSRENLRFILNNEPEFEGCKKCFVVNRIIDPDEEEAIIHLLQSSNIEYLHIPFNEDEYARLDWDISGIPLPYAPHKQTFSYLTAAQKGRVMARLYRHKNNYAINNNGARNTALEHGKEKAQWVLPWDGNCFLTEKAWAEIQRDIVARPDIPYRVVPMARVTDNEQLLNPDFTPDALEEPQIIFRYDAQQAFDEAYFYGRRPKVELLWRLGVPGPWDDWPIEPWDLPCPDFCSDAGRYTQVGWVARLFSGQSDLEQTTNGSALADRGIARVKAVTDVIDGLDKRICGPRLQPTRPVFVSGDKLLAVDQRILKQLRSAAEEALSRGPYSVLDKTTLAPSGDPHDYWHPAPYYWPNPLPIPGLPYIPYDGVRIPGTRLYEPLSERYDRTCLQRVFDDTYVLALAYTAFGDERYARHAADLVRTWFLRSDTAMAPHLTYAQVRRGHNRNRGSHSGIIEMKDLYYFLDAVRLLMGTPHFTEEDTRELRSWLERYMHWLRNSEQGVQERSAANNHGTYYDLQVASIAAFLGHFMVVRDTLRDSKFRIIEQFDAEGRQSNELKRTTTAHYCCFNLQGWAHLAKLAASVGDDLWSFTGPGGETLKKGFEWMLYHLGCPWPYEQINSFDYDRFYPLLFTYEREYGPHSRSAVAPPPAEIKPQFHPHDGLRPFWQVEHSQANNVGRHHP